MWKFHTLGFSVWIGIIYFCFTRNHKSTYYRQLSLYQQHWISTYITTKIDIMQFVVTLNRLILKTMWVCCHDRHSIATRATGSYSSVFNCLMNRWEIRRSSSILWSWGVRFCSKLIIIPVLFMHIISFYDNTLVFKWARNQAKKLSCQPTKRGSWIQSPI